MAIKFKASKLGNPQNPSADKKYYPRAISAGKVELKEIARRVASKSTTVSDIDTHAVLMALTQEIALAIQAGETVHLGDLGYFHVTIKGRGKATAEAVTADDVVESKLRFVAGTEIENALKTAKYEKSSN